MEIMILIVKISATYGRHQEHMIRVGHNLKEGTKAIETDKTHKDRTPSILLPCLYDQPNVYSSSSMSQI